jgi:hypothetical protein
VDEQAVVTELVELYRKERDSESPVSPLDHDKTRNRMMRQRDLFLYAWEKWGHRTALDLSGQAISIAYDRNTTTEPEESR